MSENRTGYQDDAEYDDFVRTLACIEEVAQGCDKLASQYATTHADLSLLSQHRSGAARHSPPGNHVSTPILSSGALDEALSEMLAAADAFAWELIQWGEKLDERTQPEVSPAGQVPSSPVMSALNAGLTTGFAEEPGIRIERESQTHDNSRGKTGVLIYTSDWETYRRYTTTQSDFGQLAHANVTYVGAGDEVLYAYLATETDIPVTISPEFRGNHFDYRVIISPQESWYYFDSHDAMLKREAMAFNVISGATIPNLTGFSHTAGVVEEVGELIIPSKLDIDIPPQVEVRWKAGIKEQGFSWEEHIASVFPIGTRTPPNFETFDFFDPSTGVATSAVTLDTITPTRLAKPIGIFRTLVRKINKAADFRGAGNDKFSLETSQIKRRVVRVAIPSQTTAAQMKQLYAAYRYGQDRGVLVLVFKVR